MKLRGDKKDVKGWYERRTRYNVELYLNRIMKYGQVCKPMTDKMPRMRFVFTEDGWLQTMRFFPRGEPDDARSVGELCFAAIEKRTLLACESFEQGTTNVPSPEQKVDFFHLSLLSPFRIAQQECAASFLRGSHFVRYKYYVCFILGLLHFLTKNALVRSLDVFFLREMLTALTNPMNWMCGWRSEPLEFDMFGDVISEPNYGAWHVQAQCSTLGALLKGFYDFLMLSILDGAIPCEACKLFRDNDMPDVPECSRFRFVKEKLLVVDV